VGGAGEGELTSSSCPLNREFHSAQFTPVNSENKVVEFMSKVVMEQRYMLGFMLF
jgi:hypothetical protein